MLHPWRPGFALGFKCLPRSAEGTVENSSPSCSLELFLSLLEGRKQCPAICHFVPTSMVSAVRKCPFFPPFCWLTSLLWSLGNSYGRLTGSRTKMTYSWSLMTEKNWVDVFWETVVPLQGYRNWLVCISYSALKVNPWAGCWVLRWQLWGVQTGVGLRQEARWSTHRIRTRIALGRLGLGGVGLSSCWLFPYQLDMLHL